MNDTPGQCEPRSYRPHGIMQLHITERCNLRCVHCYQGASPPAELPLADLFGIVGQFKELLAVWHDQAMGLPVTGHVTVTGGEPFIRPDAMELLERLATDKELSFRVLTNGTLIDADLASRLARLVPDFVQVSIEGRRETHERIRGPGSFDSAVAALRHLVRAGVRTAIAFTAHRGNYRQFADVARLGMNLQVARVWADRLVPLGQGAALSQMTLTPAETRELFEIMLQARIDAACTAFGRTEIAMHRGLQFLVSGERPYRCRAGDLLITVAPDGDVYPCRRMPIRVGNLTETPLKELYFASKELRALRDAARIPEGCERCRHAAWCAGGDRCVACATTGSAFTADPGCWLAQRPDGNSKQEAGTPDAY